MNKQIVMTLALGMFLALGAADKKPPMTKHQVSTLIQTAHTAKDHTALANYYRFEAAQLRERAAEHDAMAAEYLKNPAQHSLPKYPTIAQHCKDWAENFREAAKKADMMAASHDEMAKAAK